MSAARRARLAWAGEHVKRRRVVRLLAGFR
jgi:hypothetical protein